jgi:hypothetical protein
VTCDVFEVLLLRAVTPTACCDTSPKTPANATTAATATVFLRRSTRARMRARRALGCSAVPLSDSTSTNRW